MNLSPFPRGCNYLFFGETEPIKNTSDQLVTQPHTAVDCVWSIAALWTPDGSWQNIDRASLRIEPGLIVYCFRSIETSTRSSAAPVSLRTWLRRASGWWGGVTSARCSLRRWRGWRGRGGRARWTLPGSPLATGFSPRAAPTHQQWTMNRLLQIRWEVRGSIPG